MCVCGNLTEIFTCEQMSLNNPTVSRSNVQNQQVQTECIKWFKELYGLQPGLTVCEFNKLFLQSFEILLMKHVLQIKFIIVSFVQVWVNCCEMVYDPLRRSSSRIYLSVSDVWDTRDTAASFNVKWISIDPLASGLSTWPEAGGKTQSAVKYRAYSRIITHDPSRKHDLDSFSPSSLPVAEWSSPLFARTRAVLELKQLNRLNDQNKTTGTKQYPYPEGIATVTGGFLTIWTEPLGENRV